LKERKYPSPFLIALSLLVILVSLFFGVVMRAPRPPTPQEQAKTLRARQSMLYFVEGEIMARQLAPPGYHPWSRMQEGPGSDCSYLGNGIWHAFGWVMLSGQGTAQSKWEAYFSADDSAPIFACVGETKTGDLDAARRRAGVDASGGAGAP
jgi:hypothetical protein